MMLWLFSSILVSCSFLALGVSVWLFRRARSLLLDASSRSLAQLNAEVAELTFLFESLQAQHKRLNARVGMREARAKVEDPPVVDSSSLGDTVTDKSKLREIARARGFKVT